MHDPQRPGPGPMTTREQILSDLRHSRTLKALWMAALGLYQAYGLLSGCYGLWTLLRWMAEAALTAAFLALG